MNKGQGQTWVPSRWSRETSRRVYLVAGMISVACFLMVVFLTGGAEKKPGSKYSLIGAPGPLLRDATQSASIPFADAIAETIRSDGRFTVTVHVALADAKLLPTASGKFVNGNDYRTNLCWGALYGVETHLANAADWRRAYTDSGDGRSTIRRVVFHRRAEPTESWMALGVAEPFDVYVLTCAWPSTRLREAMDAPIREAVTGDPTEITVDGLQIGFGGASSVTGYLGPNAMTEGYWNPFEKLGSPTRRGQVGVFYLCSMSAVYLHDTIVGQGLYPVLFAREPIVPEAYLLDGMLRALLKGELDQGLLEGAAEQYSKYQKGIPITRARHMLFR